MKKNHKVTITTNKGTYLIDPQEICYLRSEKRDTQMIVDNKEKLSIPLGIEKMVELFNFPYFFRSHKCCTINLNKIRKVDSGYKKIYLICGTELPIAKRSKSALKQAILQHIKSQNLGEDGGWWVIY